VPPPASSNVVGLPNTLSLAHHHASSPITALLKGLACDAGLGQPRDCWIELRETVRMTMTSAPCYLPQSAPWWHSLTLLWESFARGSNGHDRDRVSTRHSLLLVYSPRSEDAFGPHVRSTYMLMQDPLPRVILKGQRHIKPWTHSE
jgi:hypothetical protein